MILINRAVGTQQIILTLSELTTIPDAKYLMVLLCDASRDKYNIYLPANSSTAITRYDLFNIPTDDFNSMPGGYYSYSIYQQNQDDNATDLTGDAIETGKLIIRDEQPQVEIISPKRTNDYLIYK